MPAVDDTPQARVAFAERSKPDVDQCPSLQQVMDSCNADVLRPPLGTPILPTLCKVRTNLCTIVMCACASPHDLLHIAPGSCVQHLVRVRRTDWVLPWH